MAKRKNKTISYPSYLVVKCTPLSDQFECEFDRRISYVTKDKDEAFSKKQNGKYFEVYGISASGMCVLIKECEY